MTQINQPLPEASKPPYLLGLICLIPLLGAFAGIGLLMMGIFKYKDKLLIAIGAFGILFTVAIYSFLFYYMQHGESSKKGFSDISQMQLNNLVKNIEFYKLQYGQYPIDLPQLLEEDSFAPINDVIQSVQLRKNDLYMYEKVGNKYALFSAGQDGIPNTSDDLIPQITITDSTKIGWIEKH